MARSACPMPPRPTCPGVTPPTPVGWTSHINNENEKNAPYRLACSQWHFLNCGSLFSMTSFYQVDKNLTRTLYTLQAVPLLKCYVCPHSPGASLSRESHRPSENQEGSMPSPEKGQGSSGDEGVLTTLSKLLSLNYLDPNIPLSPYAFPEESFESSGPLKLL